nr:DUF983 domain-containing protein [Microvirga sp. HBU67692]
MTGLRGRCPRCGRGRLFQGFPQLRPRCEVCGLDYAFADPADGPAFLAISIGGVPSTALEHRTDPEGRVSDPKGHGSEKWIRFSLARPAGSVLTDALIQEESIGWIPKGQVHFSRPML